MSVDSISGRAKNINEYFIKTKAMHEKAMSMSYRLTKAFSDKFGEECPIRAISYQPGDGMVVVYENEYLDSNNSLVDISDDHYFVAKLYDCKTNQELLQMLESMGG